MDLLSGDILSLNMMSSDILSLDMMSSDILSLDMMSLDILFYIGKYLDYPDLISLCNVNSIINKLLYKRDNIWLHKLINEFPDWLSFNINKPMNIIYKTMYKLDIIKYNFYIHKSLIDIYNSKNLNLDYHYFNKIPSEIDVLYKLEKLLD